MSLLFGPEFHDDQTVSFHVHAPAVNSLQLVWEGEHDGLPLNAQQSGYFVLRTRPPAVDAQYRFLFPNGQRYPDPASRYQPNGVHGPSQLVDPGVFKWSDHGWQGVAKRDLILYELHIGTFTEEGTCLAAIERLDELLTLGVTALEIMPVAQSAGRWNWGYDGVNFFAPRNTYGSPDDFRRLIDAAHARGLAVVLDVVYNHFGPEGNYLHPFGGYVSDQHSTPWGDAPNFDGPDSHVAREFVLANVRHWIRDFRLDGLRLDATHCMIDNSQRHVVFDIAQTLAELRSELGREIHLIAESNVYDRSLLNPEQQDRPGCDALWCDDFIHSVFALLRPEDHRSTRRYLRHSDFDLVLRRGYVFEGTFTEHRRRISLEGDPHPADLSSLVIAIQNHDFIGNHPVGERLHQLATPSAHMAAAALMLLSPSVPMLFMGEEFAADNPFHFFVDFGDEHLREAVEQGRRDEHPQHNWTGVESALSEFAFRHSKLCRPADGRERTLDWYRSLIVLRKQWQSIGLLTPESFFAHWDDAHNVAVMRYETEANVGFAFIRLHAVDDLPVPLSIRTDDEVILSQDCECLDASAGHWMLGGDGVLVGRGAADLVIRDESEPDVI